MNMAVTNSAGSLAKLDPFLILGVVNAQREQRRIRAPVGKLAAAAAPAMVAGRAMPPQDYLPVGMLSLAAQLGPRPRAEFLESDLVPVLVDTRDAEEVARQVESWNGRSAPITATTLLVRAPRARLADLARLTAVRYVEASYRLRPHCDQAHISSGLVTVGARTVTQTGAGVLIGIIDTGIDATHPAFHTAAGTRIVHYLDQETGQSYEASDIEAGMAAASPDVIGHGTHVAGIAAGNGGGSPAGVSYAGVAPEAQLVVVKTTFQTDQIAAAVSHVFDVARARNLPCVVNLSLGGHFGGHDGTTVAERTIDQLSGPGRLVVVSAGNEGRDLIHAATVLAPGTDAAPASWTAGFALRPRVIDNQEVGLLFLQVWHQREDTLAVRLRAPDGETIEPPANGQQQIDRGVFLVQAAHQIAPFSGDHSTTFVVVATPDAQWLNGWSLVVDEVRAGNRPGVAVGTVHAWIADRGMGGFTSGMVPTHMVGMPGTAYSAITVASYATRRQWTSVDPANHDVLLNGLTLEEASTFTSPGPTRDGANKPDVAAPGQLLISALSSAAPETEIPLWLRAEGGPYAALQGTSMAAPYVTGTLALLLHKDPTVDWAEARRRLVMSTRQDRFTQPCWNARWGYGKIDVKRLMEIDS
jgi:subtilisin family serine protease